MPNQHTKPGIPTRKQRILSFLRAHPGCTTHDIRAALGYELTDIGMNLVRLAHEGLANSEKLPGTRLKSWCATGRSRAAEVPRQIVTRSWVAPKIAGHWVDFAICAPARQLQGELA